MGFQSGSVFIAFNALLRLLHLLHPPVLINNIHFVRVSVCGVCGVACSVCVCGVCMCGVYVCGMCVVCACAVCVWCVRACACVCVCTEPWLGQIYSVG